MRIKGRRAAAVLLTVTLIVGISAGCGTRGADGMTEDTKENRRIITERGEFEEEIVVLLHSSEFSSAGREALLRFAEEVGRETGGNVTVVTEIIAEEASVFERLIEGSTSLAIVSLSDRSVLELLEEDSIYYYNCRILAPYPLDSAALYETEDSGSSRSSGMRLFLVNNDYWNSCCDDLKEIFRNAAGKVPLSDG